MQLRMLVDNLEGREEGQMERSDLADKVHASTGDSLSLFHSLKMAAGH